MTEAETRRNVVAALRAAKLDAYAVENVCAVGYPDIEYIGGHIECKQRDKWPARPDTPVVLGHPITTEQKIWIRRRARLGGRVFVLLQVEREYMLFDGPTACDHVGHLRRDDLASLALGHWKTKSDMSRGLPPLCKNS